MFLYHLLTSDDNSISKRVLLAQVNCPKTGDWAKLVQQDLEDLKINYSFEDISKNFTKQNFKKIIRTECKQACFMSLLKEKNKLSKGKEIMYEEFKMQTYLKPGHNLTQHSARRIFSLRSRDLQIRGNFPNVYND